MRIKLGTPQEHEQKIANLDVMVQNKVALNEEDEIYFCQCLHFNNLLLHPFCLDEFFTRVYLWKSKQVPPNLEYLFIPEDRHLIYYENLINEWDKEINKTNHTNQLLQVVAADIREELKKIGKSFSIVDRTFSSSKYIKSKRSYLEWSKYRYILIKHIFSFIIKSDEYLLTLDGKQIIFNYFSLSHIVTRHFGEGMKSYDTDKSHFTQDIDYEEIHIKLQEFFGLIDTSGLLANYSIRETNVRYKGIIYKIFTDDAMKGKTPFTRLNSFFPVNNQQMLNRLSNEFEEKEINPEFSVFVKKNK